LRRTRKGFKIGEELFVGSFVDVICTDANEDL